MKRKLLIWGALAVTVLVLVLICVGLYALMNSRTYQVAGRIVPRVDTEEKVVALTFDDGPTAHTPQILRALAEAGVPATFYLIGSELAAAPAQGAAIARAGHEIGNHSYSHERMVFVGPGTVRDEIERTDAEIAKTGYTGPITFRPPFGKKLVALPRYLSRHDRTTVMWDVEPDSGKQASSEAIVAEAVAQVRPGSIILLHAMYESGAASLGAIPGIITELRARGDRFVTVSQLLTR
ncbi:polysaccharide deacetylase family protein [Nocardia crassostreae]|uniref:polysaccharide deacetylase family protein n=1 Tax=Nocardia crassostreae TaxID=53428 RepID=UPI00082B40BB|nr:polysaccharide deacetylase family protein [Nocardia crassostreae]